MEPLFENKYIRSEEIDLEVNKGYFKWSFFGRPISIVLIVLYLLMLVAGIMLSLLPSITDSSMFWLRVMMIAWVPLFCALIALRYFQSKRLLKARWKELPSSKPREIASAVTDKKITVSIITSDEKADLYWDQIKTAINTQNMIVLVTRAKHTITFVKDGFTVGTYDEFRAFLKTKGFKV